MSHSLFAPVDKPARNPLARYHALAPSAGIHVSPLQLGVPSIGNTGERTGLGMNEQSSFRLARAGADSSERETSLALEKVAKEAGTPHITAVAIAYVMQKAPYVFSIVGGCKVEYLEANIDALRITLMAKHIKFLESIVHFDDRFPHNIIGVGTDYIFMTKAAAYIEKQPGFTPIRPSASD